MRHFLAFLILLLLLSLSTTTAHARTVRKVDFTCPLDGTTFSQEMTASDTTRGSMLDLHQYNHAGLVTWPMDVPKCPTDGMLLYQTEFTPEELAVLKNYVHSPAYKQLQREETSSWLIAKMKEKLGVPLSKTWYTLLQATWQAPPDRYDAYARETIRAMEAFLAEPGEKEAQDTETVPLLLGELHRRIGEFATAKALFEGLLAQPKFGSHEFYPLLIAYQLQLIAAKDSTSHKMSDMENAGTGKN